MSLIVPPGSGDPRKFAAQNPYRPEAPAAFDPRLGQAGAHGLTPQQIDALHQKFDRMLPQIVSSDPSVQRSKMLEDEFRQRGMSKAAQVMSGLPLGIPGATNLGRGTMVSPQAPYQPEFSSPDRQQYPVHRILANRYWRLFHKLDPVVGNALDLYSEMPWSDFQLVGEGVDGEVKQHFERMCEEVGLLSVLPYVVREFLTVGEAVLHCMYDSDRRMWNYIALHNPDSIEVVDAPFIHMDPIIELIPDQRLRQILTSGDPLMQRVRAQMPDELVGRLLARQNIPLDNLNVTFLARKLHPYDVRGTSIISRLWRVLMLEDAVFAATIATARRHAGPLRVAKIGNPQTGWIPGPEHEQRLLELLAQAEVDPLAWIVYHFGVQFEAFGTTDRVISVGREWETLERIKLVGLGVSKAFVHGEVTYASSVTGLQVFLSRLLSQRNFIESKWLYPKFFRPVSEMNNFVKPTQAELKHRVRVRRTAQELNDDARFIVPRVDWDKKLDPNVDKEMIGAVEALTRIGVRFSKGTLAALVNRKYEDEMRASIREDVLEAQERQRVQQQLGPAGGGPSGTQPAQQTVEQFQDQQLGIPTTPAAPGGPGAPGPGQPGGPPAYGPPPRPGTPPAGPQPMPAAPQPVPQPARTAPQPPHQPEEASIERRPMQPKPPPEPGDWRASAERLGNWDAQTVEDVIDLFRPPECAACRADPAGRCPAHMPAEAFWVGAVSQRFNQALLEGDAEAAWDDFTLYLEQHGYPDEDIAVLREILASETILPPPSGREFDRSEAARVAREVFEALPDDASSDQDVDAAFVRAFKRDAGSNGATHRFSTSTMLIGEGNGAPGGSADNPFRRKR